MGNYDFSTTVKADTPISRDTEPSIGSLYQAMKERRVREETYPRNQLNDDNRPAYLASLGKEINIRVGCMVDQIYEIGRLLTDAKSLLSHGDYLPWVDSLGLFSRRAANNYVAVYRVCVGAPELLKLFKPTLLYHICKESFPEDLRKFLLEKAVGVYDGTKGQLLAFQQDFAAGVIDLESKEALEFFTNQKSWEIRDKYLVEWDVLIRFLEERLVALEKKNMRQVVSPLLKPSADKQPEQYYLKTKTTLTAWIATVESWVENFKPGDPSYEEAMQVKLIPYESPSNPDGDIVVDLVPGDVVEDAVPSPPESPGGHDGVECVHFGGTTYLYSTGQKLPPEDFFPCDDGPGEDALRNIYRMALAPEEYLPVDVDPEEVAMRDFYLRELPPEDFSQPSLAISPCS